jgi:MFS superfamily sulfate permease-like transporter
LVGFLSGVGIQVAFGQLHEMLGIEKGGKGFIREFLFTLRHIGETRMDALVIALVVIAIIVGFEYVAPRFPAALVAVVGMISASALLHWRDHGVSVVGAVPSGLPSFGLPAVTWNDVQVVLPVAFSCFIVILAQSAATSRAYAIRYREPFDENHDLVGLSLANAAAGFSGTFIVNGSPTKTAMVDTAGGRSQWAHLTTALVVLLVLLFLTGPLSFLPNAVLAAIVFLVGLKLIDIKGLREIQRARSREFALALVTTATVVLVGVEEGIILAVVLSLLQHVRHSYRPHTAVFVQDASEHWVMREAVPGVITEPGLLMFWFGADLFYANASYFAERVRDLVAGCPTPLQWLVIEGAAITSIDFSASRTLAELRDDLAAAGVALGLVNRSGQLEKMGLVTLIGADRVFDSRTSCLDAYRRECKTKGQTATQ